MSSWIPRPNLQFNVYNSRIAKTMKVILNTENKKFCNVILLNNILPIHP